MPDRRSRENCGKSGEVNQRAHQRKFIHVAEPFANYGLFRLLLFARRKNKCPVKLIYCGVESGLSGNQTRFAKGERAAAAVAKLADRFKFLKFCFAVQREDC